MSAQKKSFCIANVKNPTTGQVFGDKYGEPVIVRRPTAADKIAISTRHAGHMSAYGANPAHVPGSISDLAYIFCLLDAVCDQKDRPEWTQRDNVYEEDEAAIYALFEEVSQWLATFRPGGDDKTRG